ncbi:hypothetical protein, partial [Burkholderia cenocepacia]|uniref:hypothetical protein n=1 Tax=Burkholderia cenocepacia TaxID=95486 RepID=UPI0019D1E873
MRHLLPSVDYFETGNCAIVGAGDQVRKFPLAAARYTLSHVSTRRTRSLRRRPSTSNQAEQAHAAPAIAPHSNHLET